MSAVYWKELADHFGRRRFLLLLGLVAIGLLWGVYITVRAVEGGTGTTGKFLFLDIFTSTAGLLPSLLFFMSFFGPLIGIALGFDSINSERMQGTLSRVLSQPVYRDNVILGKLAAGITTLTVLMASVIVAVIGLGMFALDYAPLGEEVIRIAGFGVLAVVYLSFWLTLAMTCSIFLRNAVTSALVSIGVWLFTSFIVLLLASAAADYFVPALETTDQAVRHFNINLWITRVSPGVLFQEATQILLNPDARSTGLLFVEQLQGLLSAPISAAQSLQLVWPHIVALVGGMGVLFGLSYTKFMREEIRS